MSKIHIINLDLACLIGDSEAILLNQIKYWISKCGRDISGLQGKWIYNSLKEWHKQFPYWSMHKLRKTIKSLENLGLINSAKVNCKKWNHTKWYTVDQNKYYELLEEKPLNSEKEKNIIKDLVTLPFNKDIRFFNETNLESNNITNPSISNFKKPTNRFVENQQIIITKNNYTNNISSIDKIDNKINELIDRKLEEKLDDLLKRKVIDSDKNKNSSPVVIQSSNISLDNKEQLIKENSKKELSSTKEEDKKKEEIIKEVNVSSASTDMSNTNPSYERVIQIFTEPKPEKEGDETQLKEIEDDLRSQEVNIFPNKDNHLQMLQKQVSRSKESKGIAEQMKETWDKVFQYSLNPIKAYLNKKTIIQLPQLLKDKFKNNLSNWEEYAKQVNSSQFLMGEKETKNNFKAVFPWLIKEETIDSILQGAYGVGDRELDINNLDKNIKEKEYEIRIEANKKISKYIENNIDNEKEEEEFKKYITNEKYEEDEDKYNVKSYMEKVSKYQMYGSYITPSHFFYPNNEKHKEKIFNSYLMNKYLGIDELFIKEKVREISQKNQNKRQIFEKMKNLSNNLKKVSLSDIKGLETIENEYK